MKAHSTLVILFLIICSGCSSRSYVGVHPTDPIPGTLFGAGLGEAKIPRVDSISPTLRWKPVGVEGFSYDVAVWKRPFSRSIPGTRMEVNQIIYLKEGIDDVYHVLEIELEFDTVYMWSIRTRKGDDIGEWSSYREIVGAMPMTAAGLINYSFRTPKPN